MGANYHVFLFLIVLPCLLYKNMFNILSLLIVDICKYLESCVGNSLCIKDIPI